MQQGCEGGARQGWGDRLVSVLQEDQESAVFNLTACNADGGLDGSLWIVTAIFLQINAWDTDGNQYF